MKFELLAKFKRLPELIAFCTVKKVDYATTNLSKQLNNPDSWGVGGFISILAPRLYLGDDGSTYVRWFDAELFEMRQSYKSVIVQVDHPLGGRLTRVPGSLADATAFLNQAAYVIGHNTGSKGRAGMAAVPCSADERTTLFGAIGQLYTSVFEADRFSPESVEAPQPSVASMQRAKRDVRETHHMKVTVNKPAAACVPLPEPCLAKLPACFEIARSCCDRQQGFRPDAYTGYPMESSGNRQHVEDMRDQLRDMMRAFYRDAFESVAESGLDAGRRAFEEAGDVVSQAFERAQIDVAQEAELFHE